MSPHHLHSGFFFATSTLPPVFAHHEDLHQLGVGHQLVFKCCKNLVPDQVLLVNVDLFEKHPHLLWVALKRNLVYGLDQEIWSVVKKPCQQFEDVPKIKWVFEGGNPLVFPNPVEKWAGLRHVLAKDWIPHLHRPRRPWVSDGNFLAFCPGVMQYAEQIIHLFWILQSYLVSGQVHFAEDIEHHKDCVLYP